MTCDDFRTAMADANGVNLEQFEEWYKQHGTPTVHATEAFEDGKYNGAGKMTRRDGDIYVGNFLDGQPHGMGVWTFRAEDPCERYEGHVVKGTFEGEGTLSFKEAGDSSSLLYVGGFQNNKFNGKGKMKYRNGDSYDGFWRASVRQGTGSYTWAKGQKYDGQWSEGKRHGQGTKHRNGTLFATHLRYAHTHVGKHRGWMEGGGAHRSQPRQQPVWPLGRE